MGLALRFVASITALAISALVLLTFLIVPIAASNLLSWKESSVAIIPSSIVLVACLILVRRVAGKAKAASEDGVEEWPRKVRAATALIVGWTVLVLGAGSLFILNVIDAGSSLDRDASLIIGGIGSLFLILGFFVIQKGRRLSLIDANYLMSSDKRPPLIYLRSFADDVRDRRSSNLIALFVSPLLAVHTWESHVAGILRHFGPFVAIGRPGEPLPELGAARMYVSDDEWKAKVFEILKRCKVAVFRGGQTEGLRWELGEILKLLKPRQVLLMLPRNPEHYKAFLLWANKVLPKPIPENLDTRFVYFEDDWTPVPRKFQRSFKGIARGFVSPFRAGVGLTETFAPFLQRLDKSEWQSFSLQETQRFLRRIKVLTAVLITCLLLLSGAVYWIASETDKTQKKLELLQQHQEKMRQNQERLQRGPTQPQRR